MIIIFGITKQRLKINFANKMFINNCCYSSHFFAEKLHSHLQSGSLNCSLLY